MLDLAPTTSSWPSRPSARACTSRSGTSCRPTAAGTFTQHFEYPELPVPVKPRYRGFHRFDLTTCIGCDKCAAACPVDCIYIEKIKNPVGKGFRVNGFKIDYTKCMFCALCVDPCPVDCIFMGSTYDQSCFSRDGCIVDFAKLPLEIAWGQASLNPTAVAGVEAGQPSRSGPSRPTRRRGRRSRQGVGTRPPQHGLPDALTPQPQRTCPNRHGCLRPRRRRRSLYHASRKPEPSTATICRWSG